MCQLLDGLAYLHFQHVCHRDIKPANLLVAHQDVHNPGGGGTASAKPAVVAVVVKITDFGVSQVFQGTQQDVFRSTSGTAAFLAPEMLTGGSFSGKKADLWACGMTLYAMLHGHPAFMAPSLPEIYSLISTADVPWPALSTASPSSSAARRASLTRAADLARDLTMRLLDRNPDTRPSAEEAQRHPFLTGYASLRSLPLHLISVNEEDIENAIRPTIPFHVAVQIAALGRRLLARVATKRRLKAGALASAAQKAEASTPQLDQHGDGDVAQLIVPGAFDGVDNDSDPHSVDYERAITGASTFSL